MADGKLKIDIRRKKILELLRQNGKVSVAQLSKELDITQVTVRSDLQTMEENGLLTRVQGGAVLPLNVLKEIEPAPTQKIGRLEEKRAIAHTAAGLVQDGNTLFINSGSTSLLVAQALEHHLNLNVVTNSLDIATELGKLPTFRVVLLGGEINARFGFTSGMDAQKQLQQYQADWAILSVDGISVQGGITTYHVEEAAINDLMIQRASGTLLVADHSKIGRPGFIHICPASEALCLITDSAADAEALALLGKTGLQIRVAENATSEAD